MKHVLHWEKGTGKDINKYKKAMFIFDKKLIIY